jgi:hypothetical protein
MATKKRNPELIRGHATHTRTQDSYMGVLLDAVSLDDWRGVVTGALQAAQGGDPQARNWLAQYLIGRPEGKAPTPLTVVVNQLNGADPLVNRIAKPLIDRELHPLLHRNDAQEVYIRGQVAAELQQKIKMPETIEKPVSMRVSGDSEPEK